jgi:hypothetical protein
VIPAGISVAILGLSDAFAVALGVRNATPRNTRLRKSFVFMKNFVITVLLSSFARGD